MTSCQRSHQTSQIQMSVSDNAAYPLTSLSMFIPYLVDGLTMPCSLLSVIMGIHHLTTMVFPWLEHLTTSHRMLPASDVSWFYKVVTPRLLSWCVYNSDFTRACGRYIELVNGIINELLTGRGTTL